MRLAMPPAPSFVKIPHRKANLTWAIAASLMLLAALAIATVAHDRLFHGPTSAGEAQGPSKGEPGAATPGPEIDKATTVALPEGKFQKAGIQVEPASSIELPREFAVTGRVEADPNRRVEVRPRAQGVVRSVPVLPGTKVKEGDVLVVLDSPDVGSARLLVREHQRALATARVEAARKATIADNVESMVQRLGAGASAKEVASQFANKPMGNARGTLIAAWAELEMASHEFEKMSDLNKRKIVGEHPVFLAEHTQEGAQAKFDAALDVTRYDVQFGDLVAKQAARNAEEMVVDAAQRLRLLGVTEDMADLLAHPERASALPPGAEDLTGYPIVGAIDGTIISTLAVRSQRVEPTENLFILADLSVVHAVANIPESDFATLPGLAAGGKVRLTAKAVPGRTFDAKILYVSSDVDPGTRTIRLVAEVENPENLLILNMFASIVLDTAATERVVTVPDAAVVMLDEAGKGQPAVFVPAKGERTFTRRLVKLGRQANGRQVITEGLKAGDQVVTAGAFMVKSELVLQNESEE